MRKSFTKQMNMFERLATPKKFSRVRSQTPSTKAHTEVKIKQNASLAEIRPLSK